MQQLPAVQHQLCLHLPVDAIASSVKTSGCWQESCCAISSLWFTVGAKLCCEMVLWLPAWDTVCSSIQSSVSLSGALASCLKLDNQIVSVSTTAYLTFILPGNCVSPCWARYLIKQAIYFAEILNNLSCFKAWGFEETISHWAPIQFCIYFFSRITFKVMYCVSEWNEVESSCPSLNSCFCHLLMLHLCVYLAVMSARQVNFIESIFSKGLHRHSELQKLKWCLVRESRGKQQNKPRGFFAWAILAALSNITCCL